MTMTMTMTSSSSFVPVITATTAYYHTRSTVLLLIPQLILLLLCTFLLLDGCNSFAPIVRRGGNHHHHRLVVVKSPSTALELASDSSDNSNIQDNNNNNDNVVLIMDWECILQNQYTFVSTYRIQNGIDAAIKVWPQLQSYINYYGDNDLTWLKNKLHALSHVFGSDGSKNNNNNNNISATCDYALATRMILEEQELDQGISTGKNGKYANKFHPRSTTTTRQDDDDSDSDEEGEEPKIVTTTTASSSSSSSSSPGGGSSSSSSRRPLTVGEIAVNWDEFLRDTLQMKYSIDRKDPIPILQSAIEEIQQQQQQQQYGDDENEVCCIDPKALTLLDNSIYPIYWMTSCSSDMDILQSLLLEKNDDSMSICNQKVNLLDSSSTNNIQKIIENDDCLPDGSHIVVVESSWGRLQNNLIPLFGDSIPRQQKLLPSSSDYDESSESSNMCMSIGSCIIPKRKLSLGLCDWTKSTSHPTHKMEATMNPWTQILDYDDIYSIMVPQPPSFQ